MILSIEQMEELRAIRERDKDALSYSDGSLHCSEVTSLAAEDRRTLLQYLDIVVREFTER